ncbi:MAG: ShlB/FhaC/HecB family hemolysin secretion/activation protein [Alphaproteobacteria bacterium]|nr:ShlB/FhaC/HecB family hemolysin secretion/activation protein [Alphaproteobacteria bacterium]
MKNFCRSIIAACALALSLTGAARAAAPNVPGSAEASRVQGQIAPMQVPGAPEVSAPAPGMGKVNAPEGAGKITFVLKAVTLDGVTVYAPAQLKPFYGAMIGKKISLANIYALAQKLTVKYRNDGYILSQVIIPPQTIEDGAVRLQAVEGFVDKVTVQGGDGKDRAMLQRLAQKIAAQKPLNAKTLERYILLMNDMAGVSARAVLSPSAHTAGASDVTVVVKQKPYDVFLQADNRGSRYLGPLQANAGTRLNDAFGLGEGINLQLVSAPDGQPHRELDYAGLSWSQPLDGEGTVLTLGGNVTTTRPGYTLASFDVHGLAHAYNLAISHPFIRSRAENLYCTVKFDYLDSTRNDNLGLGATEDRLRVLRLGATWQVADRLMGVNTVSAELSRGLPVLNASRKGDAGLTRALGDPKFFKGTMQLSRVQGVYDGVDLYAALSGQWSANTLLASEEFGVGGANFGSAYDSSEITGENGLAARLELRANNPFPSAADLVQLYGFYDIGKVWDWDNAVVKDRRQSLADMGFGTRVNFNATLSGSLELAVPLTRRVQTSNDKRPRLFGALTAKF